MSSSSTPCLLALGAITGSGVITTRYLVEPGVASYLGVRTRGLALIRCPAVSLEYSWIAPPRRSRRPTGPSGRGTEMASRCSPVVLVNQLATRSRTLRVDSQIGGP